MRNRTGRRRSARVLGGFLVAVVVASGAVLATGPVSVCGYGHWSVIGSPTSLRQNTQGNEHVDNGVVTSASGVGAAWSFDVPSSTSGTTLTITAAPDDHGDAGCSARPTRSPMGVNQSTPQEGNYVGFANFRNNIVEGTGDGVRKPIVDSHGVAPAPA